MSKNGVALFADLYCKLKPEYEGTTLGELYGRLDEFDGEQAISIFSLPYDLKRLMESLGTLRDRVLAEYGRDTPLRKFSFEVARLAEERTNREPGVKS